MSNQELRSTFRRSLVAIRVAAVARLSAEKVSPTRAGYCCRRCGPRTPQVAAAIRGGASTLNLVRLARWSAALSPYTLSPWAFGRHRSEEHTSELQSLR